MARIGYMLICDEVVQHNQNQLAIFAPYPQITTISMPGQYSFTLSLSIYDIVPEQKNHLKIILKDPDGKTVWDMNADFDTKNNNNDNNGDFQHTIMNIPFKNYIFNKKGIYTFVTEVEVKETDDKNSFSFPVRKKGD